MRSALLPATPATVDLSLILRGLFATAVVWWHTVGAYHTDTIPHWLNVPGRVSVWIFFGLSGYVIGHGFFSGRYRTDLAGLRVYLSRRAARILPLFWLVTALAVALTLARGGPLEVSAGNLVAAVFALQWSNTRYFVGVFWTLGLELQFYLIAPALMALLMARRRATLPLLGALWLALMLAFGADIDNRSVAGNLQHFLAGIAVAALVVRRPGIFARNTARRALGTGVAALVLLGLLSLHYGIGSFWDGSGALATDLLIVLLLLCHAFTERLALPAGRPGRAAMVLGALAYGLYAWHGLWLTFVPGLEGQFLALWTLSMVSAWASYTALERPAIRVARQLEPRPERG